MPAAAKNTRRVAKRKVVPQTGGFWPFGSDSKPAAPGVVADTNAPIAAPAAPAAPAAAEGEKKGWFSGLFVSKTEPEVKKTVAPEGEKKGWFSGLFVSKKPETNANGAASAPAPAQSGGKKRTTKKAVKATKATKSKK